MGAEETRAPAAAATLTSSTTSFITWAVAHYAFHGQIPPEVYGFLQLVVPAALGWAGACWAERRRRRGHEDAPPDGARRGVVTAPTDGQGTPGAQ